MKIAIVGAGIAGLCTALCLHHEGLDVTVYEKDDGLNEAGAGIQIPPNASIHLARLGLLKTIRQRAFEPRAIQLRGYKTSELLLASPAAPIMERAFGHPYLLIHRRDYQQILYDAAVALGIKVFFGAEIHGIDDEEPAILLSNSQKVRCDFIVGADGVHSAVRRSITPSFAGAVNSSHRAYRALITTELMETIPFGKELLDSGSVNVWLAPNRHIVGYRISDDHFNLVMMHPGSVNRLTSWDQRGSVDEMNNEYADFDPRFRSILALIKDVRAWKLMEMPETPQWSSSSGKVVLIGDAAHAMLPYAAQGAAQAVEDATVLASCLASIRSPQDLETAVQTFEHLRIQRVSKIAASSKMNQTVWELPDGPAQQARDQAWKAMMNSGMSKELFRVDFELKRPVRPASTERDNSAEAMFRKWMWGADVKAEAEAELAKTA